jgi:hydrogenase large subunit
MKAAQDKVKGVAASGQLGIFANGYWGHPQMRLSPEVNLLAFAHYLQALEFQRKSNQVVGMLGGKTPHIQNLTVGGVANAINLDSQATLGMERLESMKVLMDEVSAFIHQVYFPDACAIAAFYPDWFHIGGGVRNYLAVPDLPLDSAGSEYDLPGGYILDGDLSRVRPFKTSADPEFRQAVAEDVTHSYYAGKGRLHPWKGETVPEVTEWDADKKYSWVKAPRFQNRPAQVGPLAQVLIGYAQGHPLTRKWTDAALQTVSSVANRKVTINDMHSTMGRHLARAIRAAMLADLGQKHWQLLVNNIAKGDTTIHNAPNFPSGEISGVGTHEAPRGTLSHWVVAKDGKIKNYQAVVPSTWNASPRDSVGVSGPYEASLLRNPIADAEKPLEVLRTIHSFDPCMTCACHTFDPEGRRIAEVKVL